MIYGMVIAPVPPPAIKDRSQRCEPGRSVRTADCRLKTDDCGTGMAVMRKVATPKTSNFLALLHDFFFVGPARSLKALSRGRGSGMMAACNAESSSSMVLARHLDPVRSGSVGVPHPLRTQRRMPSSSRSSPCGRQEFRSGSMRPRCPPCRWRSFATAASRGSARSASRTRARIERVTTRHVLNHTTGFPN